MAWKELKDKVEKEVKLLRPELNVDDLEIYSVDILGGAFRDVEVGFVGKDNMVQIWDSHPNR